MPVLYIVSAFQLRLDVFVKPFGYATPEMKSKTMETTSSQ
jgi:hypothetical protein